MSWLPCLFRGSPVLTPVQQSALAALQALPRGDVSAPLDTQRYVVVDVESTGLNLFSDRLIAIGAVTVVNQAVRLGEGFEVILQQAAPSSVDNILIHGIDGTTQTHGTDPAGALLQFLEYAGNSPLVAYHADFDRTMIDRATTAHLGMTLGNIWIDLACVAPALYPGMAAGRRALDDWTSVFGIENIQRHNAVADACATAELLLVMLSRAIAGGSRNVRDLMRLEKDQRWLARR